MARKLTVADFFCGHKSIAKAFERRGHRVVTSDILPKFEPTVCRDFLALEAADLAEYGPFDVVWASPPCEKFSVCTIGKNWRGGKGSLRPKTDEAEFAMRLVQHTLEVVRDLHPKFWFIENPRAALRTMPFMQGIDRRTITFCQYELHKPVNERRMKPTDLWGVFPPSMVFKSCNYGDPCHPYTPRGSSEFGTQGLKNAEARAVLPDEFCHQMVVACEQDIDRPVNRQIGLEHF